MAKSMKGLWLTIGIIGLVGGLVHVLQPLGINLLAMFGSLSGVVQFVAGASIIAYILKKML